MAASRVLRQFRTLFVVKPAVALLRLPCPCLPPVRFEREIGPFISFR